MEIFFKFFEMNLQIAQGGQTKLWSEAKPAWSLEKDKKVFTFSFVFFISRVFFGIQSIESIWHHVDSTLWKGVECTLWKDVKQIQL